MRTENYKHSDITEKIIRAAYAVYDELGHGYLESIYERAMEKKLKQFGLDVKRQFPISVYFEGELMGDFRADLVVNNLVIIELKAVENIRPVHEAQIINYLRATEIEVGLLINFGEKLEFKRRVFSNDRKKNLRR